MTSKAYDYDLVLGTPFGAQKWDVNSKEETKIKRSLTIKAKVSLGIAIVLVCLIIALILVFYLIPSDARTYWFPEYQSDSKLGVYQMAAVSSDAIPCGRIGKDVLAKNGSAVDAAIAAMVCMGAVNPQTSGLGGGFLMLFYNRTEQAAYFLDARETAPKNASEDMYGGNATLAKIGPLSIGIPSELAGYSEAHRKYGKLAWKDLFLPTAELCRNGITVTGHLARALQKYKTELSLFEPLRNIFLSNETGDLLKESEIMRRPDLAKTLQIISVEGRKALYGKSDLAEAFLEDLRNSGSIIDKADLRSYVPEWRRVVVAHLRDNMTMYSVSPPGSGPLLAFILQVLDGYGEDFSREGATGSRYRATLALHRMLETFKFAYAKRMYMEDSDSPEMQQIVKQLVSKSYADSIREKIDDTQTYDDPGHYGVNVTVHEDHGTAHVSVVSQDGDAVVATTTVNQYFGSLILSPSTGIILNDEMDDFSSRNITNYFGVPPSQKNLIQPGKRPMSSMCPAIITDSNGDVRLAVGANGGTQITTSVAQAIVRNLFLKEDIKKTIDAPRFHHQLLPDYIEYETLFPESILGDLKELGHKTHVLGSKMVGILMGIARGEDGLLYANSDYRKGGEVEGF